MAVGKQAIGMMCALGALMGLILAPATSAHAEVLPGSLDATFAADAGSSGFGVSVPLPGGKTLVALGLEQSATGRIGLLRLDSSGAVDPSFQPEPISHPGGYPRVEAIAVQDDGKILIGGTFTAYGGVARGNIARLQGDGTLDPSFTTGASGFDDNGYGTSVKTIDTQPDGKILVGGVFTSYNGTARRPVARLTDDGTLDSSFEPPVFEPTDSGTIGAYRVQDQPDGSVLVGGGFFKVDGILHRGLVKLNSDGSLNKNFSETGSGLGFGEAFGFETDAAGKILVYGTFSRYNGVDRPGVARVNSDGTLDTSFNAPDGFPGYTTTVHGLAIAPNGRIIVTNEELPVDEPLHGVARLLPDGSTDPHFTLTGSGLSSASQVSVQSDGNILVSGKKVELINEQWVTQRRFIRLLGSGTPAAPLDVQASRGDEQVSVSWTTPSDDGGEPIEGFTATAQPGGQQCTTDAAARGCTIVGLTNGQEYEFQVTARNTYGEGAKSSPVSARPATTPTEPLSVSATPLFRSARITWQAPTNDGGDPITSYRVIAEPDGASCDADGAQTSCLVTGLQDLQTYRFTVTASNAVGQGNPSTLSAPTTLGGDVASALLERVQDGIAFVGVPQTFSAARSTTLSGIISRIDWQIDGSSFQTGGTTFTHTWTTPGVHTITAQVTGESGSPSSSQQVIEVFPVSAREAGVSINDGSVYTNTRDVTVNLGWPGGARRAVISNDGGFQSLKTTPVQDVVDWALDDRVQGTYTKVVYVRFIGEGLDGTKTYSDDIIFDNQAPLLISATATNTRPSAQSISSAGTRVRVKTRARDKISGISRLQVWTSRNSKKAATVKYRKKAVVQLPSRRIKKVSIRVSDRAGNWSKWRSVRVR